MQKIDYETALRAMNEAVRLKGPDYVDEYAAKGETCRNVTLVGGEYKPSCIVGHALVWLGVPAVWFEDMECRMGGIGLVAIRLRNAGLLDLSQEAVNLMQTAQGKQDSRMSWGDAVVYGHLGYAAFQGLEPRFDVASQ